MINREIIRVSISSQTCFLAGINMNLAFSSEHFFRRGTSEAFFYYHYFYLNVSKRGLGEGVGRGVRLGWGWG